MDVTPDPTGPGQESVWSYPRPPATEPCRSLLAVVHRGVTLAETRRGVRVLETSHPPVYYFPRAHVVTSALRLSGGRSWCEWKGEAIYFDVHAGGETLRDAAWSYPDPTPGFACLRGHVAFYAGPFQGCFVDGERVVPQPGAFYGGWITSGVTGPFKGVQGSRFW